MRERRGAEKCEGLMLSWTGFGDEGRDLNVRLGATCPEMSSEAEGTWFLLLLSVDEDTMESGEMVSVSVPQSEKRLFSYGKLFIVDLLDDLKLEKRVYSPSLPEGLYCASITRTASSMTEDGLFGRDGSLLSLELGGFGVCSRPGETGALAGLCFKCLLFLEVGF